jgi:hypothetical protein
MPHAAAWLTQLSARDPRVAIRGGIEQHALQGQPLLSLLLGLLGDPHPRRGETLGQLVANPLQLPKIKQSRLGEALRWPLEPAHRVGGDERLGQLALQPRDLGPEAAPGSLLRRFGSALTQPPSIRRWDR